MKGNKTEVEQQERGKENRKYIGEKEETGVWEGRTRLHRHIDYPNTCQAGDVGERKKENQEEKR